MSKHQPLDNGRYKSISDFLEAIKLPCKNEKNLGTYRGFMDDKRQSDWYGADCDDGHAVERMMETGWPDGRKRMNELRDELATRDLLPPVDRRRRLVRRDSGDHLDIMQVYAGRLDVCWRSARRVSTMGPQKVELLANMITYGYEHPDVLFWRGAAAAVLADTLEAAGYMVRLVVGFGGDATKNGKVSCRITVKEHGMPFDVTATSAVILPGFFRALGHAWIENHAPKAKGHGGISVGSSIVDPSEIALSHKIRDRATALAFVNDTIASLSVKEAA